MHDAATQFYDSSAKVGGISAQAASELGSLDGDASPNQKLDWIATYLSRKMDVYGIKPPSRTIGKIAKEDVRTAYFSDGAKFLRNAMYEKSIFWGDLAVRAEELPKVIDDHTEQKSAEDAFSRIRAN